MQLKGLIERFRFRRLRIYLKPRDTSVIEINVAALFRSLRKFSLRGRVCITSILHGHQPVEE